MLYLMINKLKVEKNQVSLQSATSCISFFTNKETLVKTTMNKDYYDGKFDLSNENCRLIF